MRIMFFVSVGLLLAACDSTALTPYYAAPVTATQPAIVRAAYATANVQATIDARDAQAAQLARDNATQAAAWTETSIPPAQTVAAGTAQAVALTADTARRHATETASAEVVKNSSAATAQAFATDVSNSQTQIAATRVISESLIAVANVEAASRRANARADAWQMFLYALGFIVVLGIAFLIGAIANKIDVEHRAHAKRTIAEGEANADATRAEGDANAAATIAKAEAEAQGNMMRASVFSAGYSLVRFSDQSDPVIVNRPGMADTNAAPQLAAQPAQPPMLNSAAGSRPLVAKERQEISDFLWKAVRRSGEYSKTVNTIPSHTTMGMGVPNWTAHVNTLEAMGFAEVVPNKGTFIRGYRTLEELARAVGNGAGVIPQVESESENSSKTAY